MSAPFIAGGASCAGPMAHDKRLWALTAERRIVYRDPGGLPQTIEQPIPGEAVLLAADAIRLVVLLDGGAGLRFDRPFTTWRTLTPEADVMKTTKDGLRFVMGGTGCDGAMWLCDTERRLYSWTAAAGRHQIGDARLPGDAKILAVDLARKTVVLDDGSRLQWLADTWLRLPGLLGQNDGKLRLRALSGVCLGDGIDVALGEVIDLPENEAREWLRGGRFEVAPETVASHV